MEFNSRFIKILPAIIFAGIMVSNIAVIALSTFDVVDHNASLFVNAVEEVLNRIEGEVTEMEKTIITVQTALRYTSQATFCLFTIGAVCLYYPTPVVGWVLLLICSVIYPPPYF